MNPAAEMAETGWKPVLRPLQPAFSGFSQYQAADSSAAGIVGI